MPTISDFPRLTAPADSAGGHPDLTLGLPLESATARIYPVFQTSRSNPAADRTVRQIGYLEIGDNRSDFVSLEPRNRMPFVVAALVILSLLLGGVVRRLRH